MEAQQAISVARLKRKIGRRIEVLVDRVDGKLAIARSAADAPEIDGVVMIRDAAQLTPGTRHRVIIEASDEYDLHARLAS